MHEEKRLLKVFLSHAYSDAKAMRAIYGRLIADRVEAWLDKENYSLTRIAQYLQ